MTETLRVTPDNADSYADSYADLRARLFIPLGVDGVRASTGLFEDVVEGVNRLITGLRPGGAEVIRFPPVIPRVTLEKSGYLRNFPLQLGCVCAFGGSEKDIGLQVERFYASGADWMSGLQTEDLVLSPTVCLPVYPLVASRGPILRTGAIFDVSGACFRREPSQEVGRLQSFRQRGLVFVGPEDRALAFRDTMLKLGETLASILDLSYSVVSASDPFFGHASRVLSLIQEEKALKYELRVPLAGEGNSMACLSANYHEDHFGKSWGMQVESGEVAHSACFGLGIERLVIAVFIRHGAEPATWPASVRTRLGL